jgi:uncharacterized protein (TIGR02118 family)
MFCATVLYSTKAGSSFDIDQYRSTLAPMYAKFLGANCVRFEVRKGLMAPSRPTPHFVCIASYWVKSSDEYMASLNDPRFKEVMAKFNAFTDIEPLRQFDQVVEE